MTSTFKLNELSLTITTEKTDLSENYWPISGGDDKNPTWDEYKSDYKEYFHPHLELLKKAIIELGWIGKTGEDISNYYLFKFSTGEMISFSWRAWGDLMQAIVDKKEGYMAYYM